MWNLGEGEAAKPWFSTIAEENVRSHIEAKQYANPAQLAMANYNLTRLQTGDPSVLAVPGDDATPEQWNDVYTKLGRPENADAYTFDHGEGVQADPAMEAFGKEVAFELGLNPTQAQKLAEKWNAFATDLNANAAPAVDNDAEITALEGRWGADLQQNKAAGQRVVEALGLSEDIMNRVEGSIGAAPLVELLAMIGRKSDEGGGLQNNPANGDPNNPANMTPAQASSAITALQADAEFQKVYTDKGNPGNKDAVKRMEALFART